MEEVVENVRLTPDDPAEEALWKSMTLRDKAPYRGEWIAIAGPAIVAHGRSLAKVNDDGRRAAGRRPMIRFVSFDRGNPEIEFREEMMPCDDEPYRGEWIAIHGRKIVAHGKDLAAVLKEAHRVTSGKDSFMYYIGYPGEPWMLM